jgi:mycofactocin system glycosyltransferase
MKRIDYYLKKGVNLLCEGENFYLLSEIPLLAIKVNKPLYSILSDMKHSSSLSCLPGRDRQLISLLDRLVLKGVLIKNEMVETQIYPAISIIVPVKNRPQDIEECLRSLKSLDYPKDMVEIFVVDDGSTDSTTEVVQVFKIKAILLPKSIGASACRNLAAEEARGDLLGFTDSDCAPHPQWLRELVPYFNEETIGIVGGYVSNFYHHSSLDRYEDVRSSLNMGSHSFRTGESQSSNRYVPSCNLIIRKKAFYEAGGFQEDLIVGEDVDLCWRVRKLGYQLLYVPQGEVKHKHRNDLRHMLARRYDYGTSEAILCLKHRDQRKRISFQPFHSISYIALCLGIITQYLLFFILGGGILSIDFFRKYIKIKKSNLPLTISKILWSVLRSYFSFSYLTSAYLIRYYMIFLIFLSFFYLKLWLFTFSLLIFSALVDFSIRKPKINLFFFLFFYTLDQLAYQTGVLLGCFHKRNLTPYIPALLRKR